MTIDAFNSGEFLFRRCEISEANPAVCFRKQHGLEENDIVYFETDGALPSGLSKSTKYFVITTGLTTDNFEVSATKGGSAVSTAGAGGSGNHYFAPERPSRLSINDSGANSCK